MVPVVTSSVLFSLGGIFMKPSAGFTRLLPSVMVMVCFLVGSMFLTVAVHRGGLSTTYLLGLGVEAVISVTVGMLLLNERLTMPQAAGVLMIVGGLVLVRA